MQLTWYGHSCFLLKTSLGKRILTDPFNNTLGYDNNFPKCDLITFSHNHLVNPYIKIPNNETKILSEVGTFHMNSLKIESFPSFHDTCNGLKRGPNIIFLFKDDNYSICHLGNLGHIPNDTILEKLKNIDILLIPIGGHFTLNGFEAAKLCKILLPKYIIPMQYKTNKTSLYLDDPKNFLLSMKNVIQLNSNVIEISSLDFSKKFNCILLKTPNIN